MDLRAQKAYVFRGILDATEACPLSIEEQGGILFHKPEERLVKFVRLANGLTGTIQSHSLFAPDRDVIAKAFYEGQRDGWRVFASFHTHPSFTPNPSSTDLRRLFRSFAVNIIWAPVYESYSITTWQQKQNSLKPKTTFHPYEQVNSLYQDYRYRRGRRPRIQSVQIPVRVGNPPESARPE